MLVSKVFGMDECALLAGAAAEDEKNHFGQNGRCILYARVASACRLKFGADLHCVGS